MKTDEGCRDLKDQLKTLVTYGIRGVSSLNLCVILLLFLKYRVGQHMHCVVGAGLMVKRNWRGNIAEKNFQASSSGKI